MMSEQQPVNLRVSDRGELNARIAVLEERVENLEQAAQAALEKAETAINRMAYIFGVGAGIGAAGAIILWLIDKLLK